MNTNILPAIDAHAYLFDRLTQAVRESAVEAYLVGGFIRDYILDAWRIHYNYRRPQELFCDLDVAVVGDPFPLARRFAELCKVEDIGVYENFGVAMVKVSPRVQVEFAMTRSESYRENSRKPLVTPAPLEKDAARRDFSINALYAPLFGPDFGQVWDPFDELPRLFRLSGLEESPLQLRTAGSDPLHTFQDDPLRMFRAARFAAVLGCGVSDDIKAAIQMRKARTVVVAKERIADEFNKTLLAWEPSRGFHILSETGLLENYLPELERMRGKEFVNRQGHKDNFLHTLQVIDNLCGALKVSVEIYQADVSLQDNDRYESAYTADVTHPFKLWLRWAALLHDIAKPLVKRFDEKSGWTFHGHEDVGARKVVPEIFKRLRLPMNEKFRYVRKMVQLHQRPIALVDEIVTDSAIRRIVVDAGEDLDDLLVLCRADITSRSPDKVQRYRENYDKLAQKIKDVEERDALRNWQPPITGEMIMAHFNAPPGPFIGKIKNAIREAILEGEIPNEYSAAFSVMETVGARLLAEDPDARSRY